jgi:hypothetical protein
MDVVTFDAILRSAPLSDIYHESTDDGIYLFGNGTFGQAQTGHPDRGLASTGVRSCRTRAPPL